MGRRWPPPHDFCGLSQPVVNWCFIIEDNTVKDRGFQVFEAA
jgi:hypothetical protein